MFKLQNKVKIRWSSNFAYAIGLLASDGCISPDGRHIVLRSIDRELIQNLITALNLKNKIGFYIYKSGGRKCYHVQFGDKIFYNFLNSIGLTQNKSKTIKSVDIPEKFFADFLRGMFDGDGTFYHSWDKRWPKSLVFQTSFASASRDYIKWFQNKLTNLYGVKGFICQGSGVFNLRYVKGDSRKLFYVMYYKNNPLFLRRKYDKFRRVLELDNQLKINRRGSSVVELTPEFFGPPPSNVGMKTR